MKKLLLLLLTTTLFISCSGDDPVSDPNGNNGNSGGEGSSDLTIEKAKSLIIGTWSLSKIVIDGVEVEVPNSDYQETMTFDANNVTIINYNKNNQETSKNTCLYSFSEKSDIYRVAITNNSNTTLLFDYLREKDMRTYSNQDNKVKTWQKK